MLQNFIDIQVKLDHRTKSVRVLLRNLLVNQYYFFVPGKYHKHQWLSGKSLPQKIQRPSKKVVLDVELIPTSDEMWKNHCSYRFNRPCRWSLHRKICTFRGKHPGLDCRTTVPDPVNLMALRKPHRGHFHRWKRTSPYLHPT